MTLGPFRHFRGELQLPGSKSLSNRLLLLAALCDEPTELTGLLESDDTARLREALPALQARRGELFLGNAGTAMRPLAAVLAALGGDYTLLGEPRMYERPIGPLVEALRALGADIEDLGTPGYPPLRIRSNGLRGGAVKLDATLSSQFLSALLMAAPLAKGEVTIHWAGERVSQPYVDMTLAQMRLFGVAVERPRSDLFVVAPQRYRSPGAVLVEGDASSASYFLAAGALHGPVRVRGLNRQSCQGDIQFVDVLEQMGARVEWGPDWVQVASGGELQAPDRDLRELPDAAMTLATLALFARGTTVIRGVANWKVKETDRQAALAAELQKVGARVELLEDGIAVTPGTWRSAEIETYNDHRMAMCFALATLGPLAQTILDPGCVSKTFPDFFRQWARLAS